jgi:hypothetical protein
MAEGHVRGKLVIAIAWRREKLRWSTSSRGPRMELTIGVIRGAGYAAHRAGEALVPVRGSLARHQYAKSNPDPAGWRSIACICL